MITTTDGGARTERVETERLQSENQEPKHWELGENRCELGKRNEIGWN